MIRRKKNTPCVVKQILIKIKGVKGMSNKYNLDRETYRAIKKMDRVQLEKY